VTDSAEVTLDGSSFHRSAPETGNARLPTVVRENDGVVRLYELYTVLGKI